MNIRIKKKLRKRNGFRKYSTYKEFAKPIEFIVYDKNGNSAKLITNFSQIAILGKNKNKRIYNLEIFNNKLSKLPVGEINHPY